MGFGLTSESGLRPADQMGRSEEGSQQRNFSEKDHPGDPDS